MLAFADTSFSYPDGTEVLRRLSLTVEAGQLVAVVGPSGCGKTSLLRLAAGLLRPTSGAVTRDASEVGYVFQDPVLLPWRSVRANVELPAELRKVPPEERRQRAGHVLELVGLTEFAGHHPCALSGGMRMRTSLAGALMLHPELFLLDEPFSAVDELTRERLQEELLRIFVAQRFAALFVTHAVNEAVYLSSKVVVLSPRPARVVTTVEVPFPVPRPAGLRYEPDFTEVAGEVSRALRGTA